MCLWAVIGFCWDVHWWAVDGGGCSVGEECGSCGLWVVGVAL